MCHSVILHLKMKKYNIEGKKLFVKSNFWQLNSSTFGNTVKIFYLDIKWVQ